MIMNHIKKNPSKRKLIPEQPGFRPDRNCTEQVLNLCQYIKDSYENKMEQKGPICSIQHSEPKSSTKKLISVQIFSTLYNQIKWKKGIT